VLGKSSFGNGVGGGNVASDLGGVLAAMASLASEQGKSSAAVSLYDRAIAAIDRRTGAHHDDGDEHDDEEGNDETTASGSDEGAAGGASRVHVATRWGLMDSARHIIGCQLTQ
jgi:hypothetical protein